MGRAYFSLSNPHFHHSFNLQIPNSGLLNVAVNLQQEEHGSFKDKAGIQTKGSAGSYCTENTEIMLYAITKLTC